MGLKPTGLAAFSQKNAHTPSEPAQKPSAQSGGGAGEKPSL